MSYVFFDLEWNQGYPRRDASRFDEIIQIGAYRMDTWEDEGTPFTSYVRPSIHKKLHHRVKKMLPLTQSDLERAQPFRRVIREFFRWCGEDPVFFTWGSCDARVLDTNLCWYGLEEYLDIEIYDLQRAYDVIIAHTDQQAALKDAVAYLHLDNDLEYHDAGNDAYYTARIAAEMVRRLGALPTEEQLQAAEEDLRRERREQAAQAANAALSNLLECGEAPASHRSIGFFKSREDGLKCRNARVYRCPKCENRLCNGNWYQVGEYYIARSRCVEHGRYYSCLQMKAHPGLWTGEMRVYAADHFSSELFYLCKAGGTPILAPKMPKKRHRNRKHKRQNARR